MAGNISPKGFMLMLFLVAHVCIMTLYFNDSPDIANSARFSEPKIQRKFRGDIRKMQGDHPLRLSPKRSRDIETYHAALSHQFPDNYTIGGVFEKIIPWGTAVRMCGCLYCFNVSLTINSSGNLHADIANVQQSTSSNASFNSTHVAFFDMLIEGQNGVFAKLVTDRDDVFDELSSDVPLYSGGLFNVSLTLQYLTNNSAFGLDNPQPPPLDCTLKTPKNESHIVIAVEEIHRQINQTKQRGWIYASGEFQNIRNITPILDTGEVAVYFQQPAEYKQYFVCPLCPPTENLYKCVKDKRTILLGDSHVRYIWTSLQQQIPNINASEISWRFFEHGPGIYRNVATVGKDNFVKYVNGSIPASFSPGPMLTQLCKGFYKDLQEKHHFDTWVVSSGHWDLRDDTVESYITHLEELLKEWTQFQSQHFVQVIWNGVPSFSYKAKSFGGLERRTNVKIAVADAKTKLLTAKYNITYVPFFDLSYPFYRYSCDTHHYLCPSQNSPIGSVQLNTLLNVIC
ncbi:hypothetical protein HOLleu_38409 [Holothuria leucospilota]|uniref:Uncharacterized protein n=1 Tax=Holothuria leucospilota TaxID=206669 RepID=A0A9Q0YEB4_HOLLE|nr:hypothetical protein HOLleu_38409 [Holothuria leucospilota]